MSTLRFGADIKAFADKTKIKAATVVRKVVFDITSGVAEMTPVDKGRARSNWQVAVGAMNNEEILDAAGDPLARAQPVIDGINGGEVVYIFNNVAYIEVLEYGQYPDPPVKGTRLRKGQVKGAHVGPGWFQFSIGGYSSQAPKGMARVTLEKVKANFTSIVEAIQ